MSDELDSFKLFVHSIVLGIGVLVALFLVYAYQKKTPVGYAKIFGAMVFATLAFAAVHLFEDAAFFFDWLEPYEFMAEHVLPLLAFIAIGIGAWELYNSRKY